ncbi:MAG: class I SAM-dependent methyltransferase [Micrococcaceae bacterium]
MYSIIALDDKALAALVALPEYDANLSVKWNTELRKQGFTPNTVVEILTQARLRSAAFTKFGSDADKFLYTQTALEQASRAELAVIHAKRFITADNKKVVDLGCGIGADSIAFAKSGLAVTGVEIDEVTAQYARYNLAHYPNTKVVVSDATKYQIPVESGVWLDPARRYGNSRIFNPKQFSPDLDFVFELAKRYSTGVKLGPGLAHAYIPENCEAQWLSDNGAVVELCLWFNELKSNNRRSALLIKDNQQYEIGTTADFDEVPEIPLVEIKDYLYEVDGALLRAGLLNEFAVKHDLAQFDKTIAYLTSDSEVISPWVQKYHVIEVLPYKIKVLKKYLKTHDIGVLNIKKRGIKETPEQLRKLLKPKGANKATFIVTRAQGKRIVMVVK